MKMTCQLIKSASCPDPPDKVANKVATNKDEGAQKRRRGKWHSETASPVNAKILDRSGT